MKSQYLYLDFHNHSAICKAHWQCCSWAARQILIFRRCSLGETNGPGDAAWRHRTLSTLVQIIACCLMAPSHNLHQCWITIVEIMWHSPRAISQEMLKLSILDMRLNVTHSRLHLHPLCKWLLFFHYEWFLYLYYNANIFMFPHINSAGKACVLRITWPLWR